MRASGGGPPPPHFGIDLTLELGASRNSALEGWCAGSAFRFPSIELPFKIVGQGGDMPVAWAVSMSVAGLIPVAGSRGIFADVT